MLAQIVTEAEKLCSRWMGKFLSAGDSLHKSPRSEPVCRVPVPTDSKRVRYLGTGTGRHLSVSCDWNVEKVSKLLRMKKQHVPYDDVARCATAWLFSFYFHCLLSDSASSC